MPFQDSTNLNNISKYIVDVNGDTPYTTIQAALDAANTAGGNATVFVRNGTYTENLTLYDGINLVGASGLGDEGQVEIVGVHTPPATGNFVFRNFRLSSATHIFSSAVAGTAHLVVIDAAVVCTNGYLFNVPNWAPAGTLEMFDINSAGGTDDGGVNNTGGTSVFIYAAGIGTGVGNTMIVSGTTVFGTAGIGCPVTIQGTANALIIQGSYLSGTLTTADTATVRIVNSAIETALNTAINHGSANELVLSDLTLHTDNVVTIAGAGAGLLRLGSVTYLGTSAIAGTITKDYTTRLETGELKLDDADQGSLRVNAGVVSGINQQNILYVGKHGNDANDGLTIENAFLTFGAAIAAAAATDAIVCLDEGIYVENLVDPTGLRIHASNATISGAHTMIDGSDWLFRSALVATAVTGFTLNVAASEAHLILENLTAAGTGIGILCLQGKMFLHVQHAIIANGFMVGATTADEVYYTFEEIDITGTGTAFGIAATGDLNIIGECVEDAGAGTLFFAVGAASNIAAQISKVEVANLSNITAATNVRLNVARLAGALAEVGAGGIDGICGANRIDGVPIGANTAAAGTFTTVTDTSRTQYAVAVYGAGGVLDEVATIGNAGEILTSNGAGAEPTWQAAAGIAWSVETAAGVAAAVNSGYIANRGGGVTFTIPTTAAVGSIIRICSILGLSTIAQNALESIVYGAFTTTVGAGGSLVATNVGDTIEIVCTVADTTWAVLSSVGNWTVN